MRKIHVAASTEYDVLIEKGIMKKAGEYVAALKNVGKAVIVSDETVYGIYGESVKESMENADIKTMSFVFTSGEDNKSISTYKELLEFLCENNIIRSDVLIALGGGIVGDLTGFAAATYQRGIRFVQIPTTLLAFVDSSVGGKTAVNLKGGKNQVGCFYQPGIVLCDVLALDTLPEKEFANGMAEVIKYGMLENAELLEKLQNEDITENIEEIIETCVTMKRDIVEKDEYDKGLRMLLNFGHTLGHAIEKKTDFETAHGEAVALGMVKMTEASVKAGICGTQVYDKLIALLEKYGLPTKTEIKTEELIDLIKVDKKIAEGNINAIVPESMGKCIIKTMSLTELERFICGDMNDE